MTSLPSRRWRPLALVLPCGVVLAVGTVVTLASRSPVGAPWRESGAETSAVQPAVQKVDAELERVWQAQGVTPAAPATDLQVLRRLSLALHGTLPSLEELRVFQADERPDRLDHWTRKMLADPRFSDHFAERLARGLVGTEGGQFVVYRRDRFVRWLSQQIRDDVPWDEMVRTMVAQEGLWTDRPAVNFVAQGVNEGTIDVNKLAGKSARMFLGQRIDCAQCHDHPFDDWKQHHFEGLAAYYGQARVTITGIEDRVQIDGKPVEYTIQDTETLKDRVVQPAAPFHPEWLPADGSRRQRLAAWITHRDNRRFERAIANRVWGILFGKAWAEPVDGLPDPDETPDMLDVLGRDFRQQGSSLKRLVQVITGSKAFRVSSEPATEMTAEQIELAECHWGLFPLIRLRPEQVIGSMLQASSVQTIDQNNHLVFRLLRLARQNDFVREYGDFGEGELEERGGTIPQRLLMMNGQLMRDITDANPLSSALRLAQFASSDEKCVEAAYLMCLTRLPTEAEKKHFVDQLCDTKRDARNSAVQDLLWTLFNSTEFSWNH